MLSEREIIDRAVDYIRKQTDLIPEIGMVLGSGLDDYAHTIEEPVRIPYEQLDDFPVSAVPGHHNCFVLGRCHGKRVMMMQGRVHFYEGYSQRLLTLPMRIMKRLGVKYMVLTNAAGSVKPDFKPGTLMLIRDHINFSGSNPLKGSNFDEDGPRFPDMTRIYPEELRSRLKEASAKRGIKLEEGVYMMFSGPSYETPSEVRMAACLGADAVGMSTVPEAIVCAQAGIPVIGISCITNYGAGISGNPLNHQEVLDTAQKVKADFAKVMDSILEVI